VLRLDDLPALTRTDAAAFTPPPRFGTVDLAGFRTPHPSQALAKERVRAFAGACRDHDERTPGWWPFTRRTRDVGRSGLYLDGGFGVGKTHLLAAAYGLAPTSSKRYVSFQQLVHVIGVLGMPAAKERIAHVRLLCLDEFELDDPGNTLIVKTFLAAVFERGGSVITTSNTAPEAQGRGRFDAEHFRREIQSIAERFEVVSIDGPDARTSTDEGGIMRPDELPGGSAHRVRTDWDALLAHLRRHHPARYRAQLEMVDGIAVAGARRLDDQNDALRFVHFVDTLYDLRVPLWLAAPDGAAEAGAAEAAPLDDPLDDPFDLFAPSYRDGAYAKKYRRCASRLAEVSHEARALHVAATHPRRRDARARAST